jgi:hypothetical protein
VAWRAGYPFPAHAYMHKPACAVHKRPDDPLEPFPAGFAILCVDHIPGSDVLDRHDAAPRQHRGAGDKADVFVISLFSLHS